MKHAFTVRLIAVFLVVLACEALARIGLRLVDSTIQQDWRFQVVDYEALVRSKTGMIEEIVAGDTSGYIKLDADLGWSINADRRHSEIRDGVSVELYQSNGDGIRSSREHGLLPQPGTVRAAVFGDSFSHADDVHNDFTWANVWEQGDPRLEVLNFGVPGYGTDQAFLHYQRDGKKYSPDIAILGVMSENLNRNLNTFIPFYRHDSWPNSKPRYKLDRDGSLQLHENAYREHSDYQAIIDNLPAEIEAQGAHDWWYRAKFKPGILDNSALYRILHYGYILIRYPWLLDEKGLYNRKSEHYRVLLAIIQKFADEARNNGSVPVVVIFPTFEVLTVHRTTGVFMYSPLLADLDTRSIQYVDLLKGFRKHGDDLHGFDLIPRHFSIEGNRMAAQYINEELSALIEEIYSSKRIH
jgi:hypothetical protein